ILCNESRVFVCKRTSPRGSPDYIFFNWSHCNETNEQKAMCLKDFSEGESLEPVGKEKTSASKQERSAMDKATCKKETTKAALGETVGNKDFTGLEVLSGMPLR